MSEPVTITINDSGNITAVDWEAWILNELEMPLKQADVAKTYSYIIQANAAHHYDIAKINTAIIKRWSKVGLRRVKEMAWKRGE